MSANSDRPSFVVRVGHAITRAAIRGGDESVEPAATQTPLQRRVGKFIERIARASRRASM